MEGNFKQRPRQSEKRNFKNNLSWSISNFLMVTCTICCLEKSRLVGQFFGLESDVDVHLKHLGDEVVQDRVVAAHGDVGGDVAKCVDHFARAKLITTSSVSLVKI